MDTPAWQEAWDCFQQLFCDEGAAKRIKFPKIPREKDKALFEEAINLLRQLNVPVIFTESAGKKSKDFYGKSFRPRAAFQYQFSPLSFKRLDWAEILITKRGRNARAVCHEFAHLIDFLFYKSPGTFFDNSNTIDDLVACVASYLFLWERLGPRWPIKDVSYAKSQGASLKDLDAEKEHILAVFNKMKALFNEKPATPLF